MFNYVFMQKALAVGLMIALIAPLIGQVVVLKRMSMVPDAIAHTTLSGVAIGLILNLNPLFTAIVLAVAGLLLVDVLRKYLPAYAEIAISLLMSLGIGVAGILSSFIQDANRFNAFLFGSIVAIEDSELYLIIGITALVILLFILFYKELFAITFDEGMAKHSGIRVNLVNFIFMLMMGLTLSIASKTVGTLIVSSLVVLPVASSLHFAKSYKSTLINAIIISVVTMMIGLTLSFYQGIKPGGAVVIVAVIFYIISLSLNRKKI